MFSTLSQWLFWGGALLAVVVPFLSERPRPTAGRVTFGAAIFFSMAGLAYLLSATNCWESWSGHRCSGESTGLIFTVAGTAGLLLGALLTAGIITSRRLLRRLLFSVCVPLVAPAFFPLIWSFGVSLILGTWVWLAWLIVKVPPMRTAETTHAT